MIVRARYCHGFHTPLFACTVHPSPTTRLPAPNLVTQVTQYRARGGRHLPRQIYELRRLEKSPIAASLVVSSNTNKENLLQALQPLLLANGGGWQLGDDASSIERVFKFKTFGKAWEFMDGVAKECTFQKHHPEWMNVYNKVFVRWTTHRPPGLSDKDLEMAKYCGSLAIDLGDIADPGETMDFKAPTTQREV